MTHITRTHVDLGEREQMVVVQRLEQRAAQVGLQCRDDSVLVLNKEAAQGMQLLQSLGNRARQTR